MARIIALVNQKGGVGKSTTAVNLGAALAVLGKRVLVVDSDPQGNTTTGFGIDKARLQRDVYDVLMQEASIDDVVVQPRSRTCKSFPRRSTSPARKSNSSRRLSRETRLRQALAPIASRYDFVFIDCPPSLGLADDQRADRRGRIHHSGASRVLRARRPLATDIVVRRVREALNPTLHVSGVLVTMFDGRTRLAMEVLDELGSTFREQIFKTQIPRNIRLSEAPSYGKPVDPLRRRRAAARKRTSRSRANCSNRSRTCTHERSRNAASAAASARCSATPDAGLGASASRCARFPSTRITPNPFQPRKTFDRSRSTNCSASIAEYGVLVPIIVRRRGDGYELVAGERRWRACAALAAGDDSRDRARRATTATPSKSRSSRTCSARTSTRSKKRPASRI